MAKYSEENAQIELPKLKKADLGKILGRYKPEETELDLIKKILTYDVEGRLTPFQALAHPFFKDIMQLEEGRQLSHLFQFDSLRGRSNKKEITILKEIYASK